MTLEVKTRRAPKLLHGLAVAALAAGLTLGLATSAEAGPRERGDSRRPTPTTAATPPGTHWLDVGPFDHEPKAVEPRWDNFKVEVVCGPNNDRLIKPRTDFVLYHDWGWDDGRLNVKAVAQKRNFFKLQGSSTTRQLERFIEDKDVCPADEGKKVGDSLDQVEFKDSRSRYFDDHLPSIKIDATFGGQAKPKPADPDDVPAKPQYEDKPVVVPEVRVPFGSGKLFWAQTIQRNVKVIKPENGEKQIRIQWNEKSEVVDVLGTNWDKGNKISLLVTLQDGNYRDETGDANMPFGLHLMDGEKIKSVSAYVYNPQSRTVVSPSVYFDITKSGVLRWVEDKTRGYRPSAGREVTVRPPKDPEISKPLVNSTNGSSAAARPGTGSGSNRPAVGLPNTGTITSGGRPTTTSTRPVNRPVSPRPVQPARPSASTPARPALNRPAVSPTWHRPMTTNPALPSFPWPELLDTFDPSSWALDRPSTNWPASFGWPHGSGGSSLFGSLFRSRTPFSTLPTAPRFTTVGSRFGSVTEALTPTRTDLVGRGGMLRPTPHGGFGPSFGMARSFWN